MIEFEYCIRILLLAVLLEIKAEILTAEWEWIVVSGVNILWVILLSDCICNKYNFIWFLLRIRGFCMERFYR